MIDIATLRAMAAAGASVDVILAAVEAAQKIEAEKLTARREKDAARQRRHRTARTSHAESQPVTRTVCDTPPAYTTPPLRQKAKKLSVYVDASEIPENPSDEAKSFALSKGWDAAKIALEWQRFRDHALNKGRKIKNLMAAWRNWVTSPFQSNPPSSKGPAHVAENRSLVAAARRAAERFAGETGMGNPPGEPVLRLVSEG